MQNKVPPFFACHVSFIGFSKDEQQHMEEILLSNGGQVVPTGDPSATHLVVEERNVKEVPFECPPKLHVVRSEVR